ncbi:hypothetical protein SAMN05444143_102221 [Flavobacterium succinicans]|uniref:Uncharacterized protein n=1 Tax=Flavobacterium succinicans TaxID=29536 RepID=A0A1I4TQ71_9FLAO|nr:hypothetical protein SAMN05444143_102221 [Flavobacterium succinicans]
MATNALILFTANSQIILIVLWVNMVTNANFYLLQIRKLNFNVCYLFTKKAHIIFYYDLLTICG